MSVLTDGKFWTGVAGAVIALIIWQRFLQPKIGGGGG